MTMSTVLSSELKFQIGTKDTMTIHGDKHHKERSRRFVHQREREREAAPAWGTGHHPQRPCGQVERHNHFQPQGPCKVFMVVVLLIKLVTNSGVFLVYGMNCLLNFVYILLAGQL